LEAEVKATAEKAQRLSHIWIFESSGFSQTGARSTLHLEK